MLEHCNILDPARAGALDPARAGALDPTGAGALDPARPSGGQPGARADLGHADLGRNYLDMIRPGWLASRAGLHCAPFFLDRLIQGQKMELPADFPPVAGIEAGYIQDQSPKIDEGRED